MANYLSSQLLAFPALSHLAGQANHVSMTSSFAQQLRTAMKEKHVTGEELAARLDVHPVTISKLLNGRMRMSEDWMARLAGGLGTSVAALMKAETSITPPPTISLPSPSDRPLPVFGMAAGSVVGAHVMSESAVEYVSAPSSLATVRDAYALIVTGASMEPRYFSGDMIFLNPHRPVRQGDHVAIQEARGDGVYVSVKRFERLTDEEVVATQYNPPSEVRYDRRQVIAMHRVLTTNELLGV